MPDTTLLCWEVHCETESTTHDVWSATAPTECPTDAGHTLTGVNPSSTQEGAREARYMNDGNGRVFRITVDQNGNRVSTQIAGPAPA